MSSNPGDTGQTVGFSFECVYIYIYIYIDMCRINNFENSNIISVTVL